MKQEKTLKSASGVLNMLYFRRTNIILGICHDGHRVKFKVSVFDLIWFTKPTKHITVVTVDQDYVWPRGKCIYPRPTLFSQDAKKLGLN